MSVTLLANTKITPALGGGTTPNIDTTGATLLVCVSARYSGSGSGAPAIADSKSNSWIGLTDKTTAGPASRIWYVKNPVVGTGHNLSFTGSVIAACAYFLAFSGIDTTQNADQENGATAGSGTTISTGSVTPSTNGQLLIAGLGNDSPFAGDASINGGFSVIDQDALVGGTNYGGACAYLIQGAAAAANPAWTWGNSTGLSAATIATFKALAGAAPVARLQLPILQAVNAASTF